MRLPTVRRGVTGDTDRGWTPVWVTAPLRVGAWEVGGADGEVFRDTTIRQTFRLGLAADAIRLTVSNLFGDAPLVIASMTVAAAAPHHGGGPAGSPRIAADTAQRVTFRDSPHLTIPPKCARVSDPITLHLAQYEHVTVSIYFEEGQSSSDVTAHYVNKTDTWTQRGDCTFQADMSEGQIIGKWFYLTEIEALWPVSPTIITCFGDSITDTILPVNTYAGWHDYLAKRLERQGAQPFIMLNEGISGDQLCTGGLARFQRDVLRRFDFSNDPWRGRQRRLGPRPILIVHIGVNDIGGTSADDESQSQIYQRLISAYQHVCRLAHEYGLLVIGTTVMPFTCPPGWPTPWPNVNSRREETRQAINRWILGSSDFDHVVDFSAAVTDPRHPDRMYEAFQISDFIHPSPAGYEAMAAAIDLNMLDG